MIKSDNGYRAMLFESILAFESSKETDDFIDRRIYTIDSLGGLWRRIGYKNKEKGIVAFFGNGLIRLMPMDDAIAEILQAGFHSSAELQEIKQAMSAMISEDIKAGDPDAIGELADTGEPNLFSGSEEPAVEEQQSPDEQSPAEDPKEPEEA